MSAETRDGDGARPKTSGYSTPGEGRSTVAALGVAIGYVIVVEAVVDEDLGRARRREEPRP